MANRSDNAINQTIGNISSQLGSIIQSSSNSAIEAEKQAAAVANAFNASQAALNRQFQQASAEREMQFSANEARLAREFSAAEAEKQRQYEERLSSTSYQRAYQDMVAAGLNPMLLYTNLNGASTPSGSSAQSFMGSGASASGSSASGYKADIASAKKADLGVLDSLVPMLLVSVASSALDSFKGSKLADTVGSITDKLGTITSKITSAADYLLGGGMKLFGKGFNWLKNQFPSLSQPSKRNHS